MANYDIEITLDNDFMVTYTITDGTIDPVDTPDTLTTSEHTAINQILNNVGSLRAAGIKRVEIVTE